MCLEKVDTVTNTTPGEGYKVVEKTADGKYVVWDCNLHSGKVYPLNKWLEDTEKNPIPYGRFTNEGAYPTGFHCSLSRSGCDQVVRDHCPLHGGRLVVIKVEFTDVVASGINDIYGMVKVARWVKNLGEVREEGGK